MKHPNETAPTPGVETVEARMERFRRRRDLELNLAEKSVDEVFNSLV